MAEDRLPIVREMILADDDEGRAAALERLLPIQQRDFAGSSRAMAGLPVTIRLLDPPLHEFLPDRVDLAVQLASAPAGANGGGWSTRRARARAVGAEPDARHPGLPARAGASARSTRCRCARSCAARSRLRADGDPATVEIMIPLVAFGEELRRMRELVEETVAEELERTGERLDVLIGTMIELPRAALCAGELAGLAEFFSFGTNDLTQTALGLSRDDAETRFLATYLEDGVIERNPFQTIDIDGVGELVAIGCERGRAARPDLKLGICGEHGGDPESVAFFHATGLDYVSCSPFRVPIARLAAAQAVLAAGGDGG